MIAIKPFSHCIFSSHCVYLLRIEAWAILEAQTLLSVRARRGGLPAVQLAAQRAAQTSDARQPPPLAGRRRAHALHRLR